MKSALALVLLAVPLLALWFLGRNTNEEFIALPAIAERTNPVEEQLRDAIELPSALEISEPKQDHAESQLGPKLEFSRGKLEWEARIESITEANDLSDTAKSRRLLAMIAALPEHAMTTATEEAVKRLADEDYNSVALPVVANPQTHGLVGSVLFADLMERPSAIALPALLRIARIPNHPYAPFAQENLDLLIGQNFGADWQKWEAAVQKSLDAEK